MLLVDSGNALVLAELKVIEDDGSVGHDRKNTRQAYQVLYILQGVRKFFHIETFNQDGRWTVYLIHSSDDLNTAKELIRENFTRLLNKTS